MHKKINKLYNYQIVFPIYLKERMIVKGLNLKTFIDLSFLVLIFLF